MSSTDLPGQTKGYNRMGMLQLKTPATETVSSPSRKPSGFSLAAPLAPGVSAQHDENTPRSTTSMEWEQPVSQEQPASETTRFLTRNDKDEVKVAVELEPSASPHQNLTTKNTSQDLPHDPTTADELVDTTGLPTASLSQTDLEEVMLIVKTIPQAIELGLDGSAQHTTADLIAARNPNEVFDGVHSTEEDTLKGLYDTRDILVGHYNGLLQLPRVVVLGMAVEEFIRVFDKEFHDWFTEERAIKLMKSTSWNDVESDPTSGSSGQVFRGWAGQQKKNAEENFPNVEPESFRSSTNISELDFSTARDLGVQSSSLSSNYGMKNGIGPVNGIPFRVSPLVFTQQFSVDSQEYLSPPPNSAVSPLFLLLQQEQQATDMLKRAVSNMSRNSRKSSSRGSRPVSSLSAVSANNSRKKMRTVAKVLPLGKDLPNIERSASLKDLLFGRTHQLPNFRVVRRSPTSSLSLSGQDFKKSSESIVLNPTVPDFVPSSSRLAMNLPQLESQGYKVETIPSLLPGVPTVRAHMEVPRSGEEMQTVSPRRFEKFVLTDEILDQYVPRPLSPRNISVFRMRQHRFKDLVNRKKMHPEEVIKLLGPSSYPEFC